MPVPRQKVGISGPDGTNQKPVAHGPAVDEEIEVIGNAPILGR